MIGILNTRPLEQAAALSALLRDAGYAPQEVPLVELVMLPEACAAIAESLQDYDGVLLSSPNLLPLLAQQAGAPLRKRLAAKPWYLISGRARAQVEGFGGRVAFVPTVSSLEGFCTELPPQPGLRLLHLCSVKTRLDPARFAQKGIIITNITSYAPHCPPAAGPALEKIHTKVAAVLFASGSAVHNLFSAAPAFGKTLGSPAGPLSVSIGPSATEALHAHGVLRPAQTPTADNAGFLSVLNTRFTSVPRQEKFRMNPTSHAQRYARARKVIPGGVNSPVRAFTSVGGAPVFMASAQGALLYDADGRDYVDFVLSWGPMILGHAHPPVVEAVCRAAERGLSFGACTEAETEMAETLCRLLPSLEKVRLVCSGTEATMAAVRLARGATGREKIVKFRGCYHGHGDSFLVQAGSGALTFGHPSSPGVTRGAAQDTLLADFNDPASVQALFAAHGSEIAAVIVEPVVGNMGVLIPEPGFLQTLRDLCDGKTTLLLFDEVMTGFRVALQGAQGRYGIRPDLTTLGKIVGGGMPLAAYGGRADIMDRLSPDGPVYQAGTLSGNPVAVAAGLATLKEIERAGFYDALEKRSQRWEQELRTAMGNSRLRWRINRVGSMLTVFFAEQPVRDFASAVSCDTDAYAQFFQACLSEGLYLAPSQFEAGFLSIAHDDAVLDRVASALEKAVPKLPEV